MKTALIADIGGTNARFELVNGIETIAKADYEAADFPNFADAVQHFLNNEADGERPKIAVFAIAAPIDGDIIHMTNSPWDRFSIEELKAQLELDQLDMMNDFKAVALGVLQIEPEHIRTLHEGLPQLHKPKAIIGPGTGLGVASLIHDGINYIAVEGEGGHVTMPAVTEREFKIFDRLKDKYHHISAERVCSGKGLINLYTALCALEKKTPEPEIKAAEIAARGIAKTCPICEEAVTLMCAFLGRVAGNLALILKAQGGVYIAGGIPQKWDDYLLRSPFLSEFFAKGRLSDAMQSFPIYQINHPSIGMLGIRHQAMGALNAPASKL